MKFFIKTKLSENISETPEGFLLCRNVPLTHTGVLRYMKGEHPFDDQEEVVIRRMPEELFSKQTTSSFEGKDITVQHPEDFVSPDNYQELTHGVMFNVRKLPDQVEVESEMVDVLGADFLIKSKEAIELVKSGMREVSLGYDALWSLIKDGEGRHEKIIGNHCALVDEGRAGKHCAITDHKKENDIMGLKKMEEKFKKLFGKSLDEAVKEKEDEQKAKDEAEEAEAKKKADEEKAAKDAEEAEKKKKEEESKDAEGSVEERLGKLELVLEKILEKLSEKPAGDEESTDEDEESEEVTEDESEDEESEDEESEDEGTEDEVEEEKEKAAKAGDTLSRAEILAPGIKNSKDVMKKALASAYKTADGKKVIDSLTGGKNPNTLSKDAEKAVFVAAAAMMKTKRVGDFAAQKIMTIDSFPALKGTALKSAEEINKMNEEFYNNKK